MQSKSNVPVIVDPRVQLDKEMIEAWYEYRAKEDQERMHMKVQEER